MSEVKHDSPNIDSENTAEKPNGHQHEFEEAFELTGHGCYNYLLLTACSIISCAFALDLFGYSVIVTASSCDLRLGMAETGILASAPFAGVLFSFPWGYYSDTNGRRRALILSTGVAFLFAALSSFAGSWQFMLVVKLLGCSFSTASFTLAMTLLGESTISRHRSRFLFIMMSFNLASEWVGFTLAYFVLSFKFNIPLPWLGITYRPWRLLTLLLSLPLAIGAVLVFYLQESPKYLANKGEIDKALEVLKRIHRFNVGNKEDFPVKYIITPDELASETKSFWSSVAKHTLPIFKPPLLRRTIQLFFLLTLCCSVNNVYLMWYPTIVNSYFNSLSGSSNDMGFCERITDVPTINNLDNTACNDTIFNNTIYSGILCGLFYCLVNLAVSGIATHRRLVLMGALSVAGVSAILVDNLRNPVANVIFFTLLQAPCLGTASVMSYFVDLYPTSYRGFVTNLGMMVARLTSFAGTNFIGTAIINYCSPTFYCTAALVFSGIVVSFYLPPDKKTQDTSTSK